MTDFYDNATITFNGQPLARTRVEVGERRKGLVFGDVDGAPKIGGKPPPWTASFTATCSTDALKVFAALQPVATPAVTMTVPWSILGNIEIRGWIDESRIAQNEKGTIATLGMVADEKSLRRAIANAVRRVIERRAFADLSAHDATSHKDPDVREMGQAIERGVYRGEKKRRRAMRRLLRAAGITRREI